ncbi:hypothetical protein, partial [Paenibacillus odorifer]
MCDDDFYTKAINTALDAFHFTLPMSVRLTRIGERVPTTLIEQGGAFCDFRGDISLDGTPEVVEYVILIHEDIRSVNEPIEFETGIRYRIQDFFDSIEVEFTKESLFLFSLLHELGHAVVYEKFRRGGTEDKYPILIKPVLSSEDINSKWIDKNGIKYYQYLNIIEA